MAGRDRRRTERRHDGAQVPDDRRQRERRAAERRAGPRLPVELWMEELADEATYFRCAGNVGPGGVYFDRAIPHPVGKTVRLRFQLPGDERPILARGEVVSATPGAVGMGLKFVDFDEDGRERLQRYVERHEQAQA